LGCSGIGPRGYDPLVHFNCLPIRQWHEPREKRGRVLADRDCASRANRDALRDRNINAGSAAGQRAGFGDGGGITLAVLVCTLFLCGPAPAQPQEAAELDIRDRVAAFWNDWINIRARDEECGLAPLQDAGTPSNAGASVETPNMTGSNRSIGDYANCYIVHERQPFLRKIKKCVHNIEAYRKKVGGISPLNPKLMCGGETVAEAVHFKISRNLTGTPPRKRSWYFKQPLYDVAVDGGTRFKSHVPPSEPVVPAIPAEPWLDNSSAYTCLPLGNTLATARPGSECAEGEADVFFRVGPYSPSKKCSAIVIAESTEYFVRIVEDPMEQACHNVTMQEALEALSSGLKFLEFWGGSDDQ